MSIDEIKQLTATLESITEQFQWMAENNSNHLATLARQIEHLDSLIERTESLLRK